MRISTILSTLLFSTAAVCQSESTATQVMQSSYTFSDGLHPTMVVNFDKSQAKDAEKYFKDVFKDISEDLSNKKEIRASGVRIAGISADTMSVLCAVEEPKKSADAIVHVAFLVNGEFISTTSGPELQSSASEFVYTNTVGFKRQILQERLANEEKELSDLTDQLASLDKEKGRSENTLEKTRDKGTDAAKDKVQAEADLKNVQLEITAKRSEVGTDPTEENTKELQDLLKDESKLQGKIEKYTEDIRDAEKKVKDLEEEIKQNIKDQEVMRKNIETKSESVEATRVLFQSVR